MNQISHVVAMVISMILLFGMFLSSPVNAAEKKARERLAVLDLEAKYGVDKGLAEALSVIVRDKLHSFGDYQVMSKEDIQTVASREQLMQAMGCDDGGGQCLVDFGRAIGTRFMVAGDISKLGATYTISLRMLDTKGNNPGVSNRVSENCKCEEDALIGTVEDVAAKLVGKPTSTDMKKMQEEKKIAEEKKRTAEVAQIRVAEEKKKADTVEKQRIAAETEKLIKDKGKLTVGTEQKTEQEKLKDDADRNRVRNLLYKNNPIAVNQNSVIRESNKVEKQKTEQEKPQDEADRNRVKKLLYKTL